MRLLSFILLNSVGVMAASAQIQTQAIEYKNRETELEGYLAYDGSLKGKRPGVLIVHQWKGLTDYEKKRAEMLAELGKYKANRELLRARARAGLAVLQKQELADPKRIAAIGYCFGGTTVIELARSGAEIAGVVSFHGALDSPRPEDGKNIKCKVLALHGADDPFVPVKDVAAFEDEMRLAKVDWQLVKFGGAVHGFTDWNAGRDNSK